METSTKQLQMAGPTRWDNPIPMPCDQFITRFRGSYLGAHARYCSHDAGWIYLKDEEVIAFRCQAHKHIRPEESA